MSYFDKIISKIIFWNVKNKEVKIAAHSNIRIDNELLQIQSRKMAKASQREKFRNKFQNGRIPIFNEENIHQIRVIARQYKVDWPYIMNFHFNLRKISYLGFETGRLRWATRNFLVFQITSNQGPLKLILSSYRGEMLSGNKRLIEIYELIKKSSNVKIANEEELQLFAIIDMIFLRNKIEITDEFKFWIKALESSDIEIREEAIISLGELGDKRALHYLEKLLKEGSKSIQDLLKKAIKSIKS